MGRRSTHVFRRHSEGAGGAALLPAQGKAGSRRRSSHTFWRQAEEGGAPSGARQG